MIFNRPLITLQQVEDFLTLLEFDDYLDLADKIQEQEVLIQGIAEKKDTKTSEENRDKKYRNTKDRGKLREEIINELFTLILLDDDDKLEKGIGGSVPKCGISYQKKAYHIIGLPASGKSSIAKKVSEHTGSIILDSDFAKRKLPEFDRRGGATLVHAESGDIIFGLENENSLLKLCLNSKANIVVPKIGHRFESVAQFSDVLKINGYENHLILVNLDRRHATKRALERFKVTGRYVPISLIFDSYANDPTISYYKLRDSYGSLFKSFIQLSTDVKRNEKPLILDYSTDSLFEIFS